MFIFCVIPAIPSRRLSGFGRSGRLSDSPRRESFRKDSGPIPDKAVTRAGMTEIWNCGRDHKV
ncbi:MAG: hypothetical protein A2Y97_07080 [Nitrospirae bacterium RBG_13_39_12]|nr:MAG: hypothetical protein A2Y97_07080 [Nitrospirae bacterium RBG_13_39_12]